MQALDSAAEPCTKLYGSKEDDDLALKSLSNIDMNEDQSKETSVSLILDSLEDLSEVPAQKIMIYMLFLMLWTFYLLIWQCSDVILSAVRIVYY